MASEISKLLEVLMDVSAHRDLSEGPHLDPLLSGLRCLHVLLTYALRFVSDGDLGLRLWSRSQIAAVAAASKVVVAAAVASSTPVDRLEPLVVAIVEKSVELCVSFLELSEFDSDDFRLENDIVQLLEIALLGGNLDPARSFALSTIFESMPIVQDLDSVKVSDDHHSSLGKDEKSIGRVLTSSGNVQQGGAVKSLEFPFSHVSRSTVSYAQNWAIVHVKCMPRLLLASKELFNLSMCSTKQLCDENFKLRNSFALTILKLLGKLTRDSPCAAIDCELLNAVVFFANNLLALFRHGFEFDYGDTFMGEDSTESQVLLLMEEFIRFVQTAFSDDSISQNIRTCIVAAMMDSLDADLFNYDRTLTSLHPPLVYFPKVVLYLLRLLRNIKNQEFQAIDLWKTFDIYPSGCLNPGADACSWDVGPRKILLVKNYAQEEHLRLVFHPSKCWTENLIRVAHFLHSEGIKSTLKAERLHAIQTKISVSSGSDSPFTQEDDALFGNLFSEAVRPSGTADGRHEQSSGCPSVPACCYLIHVSMEVLTLLKTCAFSPEWSDSIYSDACKKIDEMQINYLLSILSSQLWLNDEKACESGGGSLPERNINDICFELLQNIFANNVLSTELEEHLVNQILKVENGRHTYNNYTLALLAHIFISRLDAASCQLITNAYRGFVKFILEKANNISSCSLELNDLQECLPTVFHMEVLLMAFHLSSDSERVSITNMVLNSLKTLDSPSSGCNAKQVSLWGLLVSRLLLVIQHVLLYPTVCPSWLVMQLKSRLGEVSQRLHSPSGLGNHHFVSGVSLAVKNIMSEYAKDATSINSLLPHLIDFYPLSSTDSQNKVSFLHLKLDSNEIVSKLFHIVSIWEDRKAESVEDLILERYIFMMCWDTSFLVYSSCRGPMSDWKSIDFNEKSFFSLGQFLLIESGWKDADFHSISSNMLHQLQSQLQTETTLYHGWGFLRNGSCLSLLVSLLYSGIWKYAVSHEIDGVEPPWNDSIRGEDSLSGFSEKLIGVLFQENHIDRLICILSSCLKMYLKAFRETFLNVFDRRKCFLHGLSPMMLLKHTSYDGSIKDELLEKCGSDSGRLDFCFGLLAKLDNISRERNAGYVEFFHRQMLHGMPCYPNACSAAFLSCVLIIQDIVYALDGLLKVRNREIHDNLDVGLLCDILTSMMSIKSDKIFRVIHEKCGEINGNLDPMFKGSTDYSCLFQLKDLENFLTSVNLWDSSDLNIHDTLVITVIDLLEKLKQESSTTELFKLYLNTDGVPIKTKEIFGSQQSDPLVLINALDKCCSEAVTVKVLNFFIDLFEGPIPCPATKEKVLQRFMKTDMSNLSRWMESRLLGSIARSPEGVVNTNESLSVREATMKFMNSLLFHLNEPLSGEFHDRLVEAMLISLDSAFISYDICTAKTFFNFLLQFLNGKPSIKHLLERVVSLIRKLGDDDGSLQVLKFLIGFLGVVLGDCGSLKSSVDKLTGKLSSNQNFGAGSQLSVQVSSRKRSDSLVLQDNPGTASVHLDCEAISADEDEDDGTSDGELGTMEKDEEDSNSEKTLASKVCTFTSSGNNFMEQHWYFCYTCDLTVSKGCCSICAKVCHRGHRVVYSRSSRFFCDCGAGGVRGSSCQCLKPRKFAGSNITPVRSGNSLTSFMPLAEVGDQAADSDSDLDDDMCTDIDNLKLSIPKELQDVLATLFEDLGLEDRVLELCYKLLPSVTSRRSLNISKEKKVILGDDKVLSFNAENLQLKKTYKGGSFDLKIRADYSNSRELKSHLNRGSLTKSLLSISGRGRLAAGEGDKVSIFDVGQLIGQQTVASAASEKSKPLSKNAMRFEIVSLTFNPIMENYLLVAGYEECQVLTVNPRGEVTDRLAVELALQGSHIRRANWVPGSQVQLLVVTNMFVKIYDLSQDNFSPIHYFTIEDDSIVDAVLIAAPMGKFILLVLSEIGRLFRLELSMECSVGAKPLKEIFEVPKKDANSKGLSLHYSPSYRLLFLSYQDGTTLVGYLDINSLYISEVSALQEIEHESKLRPAALHHWKELLPGSGIFVCFSSLKQNGALSISFSQQELIAQNIRHVGGSSSSVVGIAAYKPLSKDKSHCLVLHDDGSLQVYVHTPIGGDSTHTFAFDQAKKLGAGLLNNKAYATTNPEFPLDFFEKTMCITTDVKFSSEATKNSDSEGTKQRLASDDGFLESPSPAGFKISVSNTNPEIVMVGFRVHVGNTSPMHVPSDIAIFHRKIKLDEGMRSWYDVPFTVAESLLADEEFVISVGPTFDGSSSPRIDSLEVYGRSKDEFGWKEKMDTILAMEADLLGSTSGASGCGRKSRAIKASSAQEQVLADSLKLLSKLYSLRKSQICNNIEDANRLLAGLKCRNILEQIFESDREPLLQSASCHVLQAIIHKKEVYYHVKDTMCLLGVVKSSPALASWIGVGGAAAKWVIKEFTAKMRAVSKITMLRPSNMVAFLETHGSIVVDGLMQVLWGILDLDQPDTQMINTVIIPAVELIYSYAECLAFQKTEVSGCSVGPAVRLLKSLIFAPYESVQTSSSLAISSRLLQVPFPKQTMLATDDSTENPVAIHSRLDASNSVGENGQAVLEEEPGTSSVQYCCDGCSTVPILRRRWHCNVCPDFDLCEACYESMDVDRLPSPHSKDHPMSAVPIEMDSMGIDGNEIQFYVEELGDGSLIQGSAPNVRMQNSPPTRVLESNESGEFPGAIDQRVVSISASKRAVNSLLLLQLVAEVKGWMTTTSGIRAIPVMQLFYRLSSAVGGPFMDSSNPENLDLEKFVKWFLDEINLDKPFNAKTRSSFGEITILVFMFFTLMLRNWHQPGVDSLQSKGSGVDVQDKNNANVPSSLASMCSNFDQDREEFTSQLLRACSYLRQQGFVNYLMDMLHQMVPHFKSSSSSAEGNVSLPTNSGCGSLLSVRKELPAGNYSPFFSDSYAKTHRMDLFMDYHKLLLENTFRLLYSLIRPEKHDRSADKEKIYRAAVGKDLKLDGYQDVLCNYISNPNTSFVRRYARRLFLHLCGSKSHYYNVRDSWQFSHEVKRLYKLVRKSGGLQNVIPYERSVKLVKCLSTIAEVATVRPRNWQKYCSKHVDILPFLLDGVFLFTEESVIQGLKLLNLGLYPGKDAISYSSKTEGGDTGSSSSKSATHSADSKKKRKAEDGTDASTEKLCLDMEHAVEAIFLKEANVLRQFIDTFLLDWNSSSVRTEAKFVLHGAWHHGKRAFKETLLTSLLQKIKSLPMFGQNIVECFELLTLLLGKLPDSSKLHDMELITQCLMPDIISSIFETLHSQNELLANHPNSRIYNTLSALVEFDGYYLESEPCVACSCPEVPFSRMKLETLKFETKYTDNRIIVKCTGSYTIQSVTMNVNDSRKSKSVKVLNLYYNNRPVSDLSELKNNWSLWKRAKSCQLSFNQTELKVEFPIPITACNFMIELDSFYENLQASSLESLQCPRCSRPVTDKHGICSNCHENAYQCRQCRNINYENLDSFLCNECGYSKYGRFEFNFMARPSFLFDSMENDEDMKKGLSAIDSESENAHRRYQQLMGFKKPLLKLVSSIGEHEMDSQQKDTVQQMMVSLPGPSCKINRKIALLGVLYGEKCKAAFDSVSKSVQTLQGLRRVLMTYLQQKDLGKMTISTRFSVPRSPNNCYGCATTFVAQCMDMLQVLSKFPSCRKQLVASGILSELFENNIHQGPKAARTLARVVLCAFSEGDANALSELNNLIQRKVMYCLEHHRSMDIAQATREELLLLSETCAVVDDLWEARLRIAFQLLFASIKCGAKNPVISEHIILPCLRIVSQACTPPKSDTSDQTSGKSGSVFTRNEDTKNVSSVGKSTSELSDKHLDACRRGQDIPILSYTEWERGASYLDFVRRQYKISQAIKANSQRSRQGSHRTDYLALKYGLRWKRLCCKRAAKCDFSSFGLGSWVAELILSSCSQSIRAEVCNLISLLCPQNSPRRFQLLNLLMTLLPATLSVGESAAEYFELFFKVIDSETSRLFLTAKGFLAVICRLISQEVINIESQERSLNIDISQGFIIHKLVELLSKFLEIPNIRFRFMRDELLTGILESLMVIRGLVVQKTKLISDCNKLLKDLLDSLLLESVENKRQFIRACISSLQVHGKERKGRTCRFILEQLCNIIFPSKAEPVYHLILNKAHTQEEFIRGSMTKNPYSSSDIGPLMRDVKNKICHQLDLLGLLEDDYGMELLVAGNIISLDLSISQVFEQVWKKSQSQLQNTLANSALLASDGLASGRDCPPMTVTYRLQGLDGEATEPMIKELEEEREESLDPEIEFAIAGSVREFGGLEIILSMIQSLQDDDLKSNQEELGSVLSLLLYCCKIRENRRALLRLGALGLLLETARRAFSVDAMEPAEGILLIVESLTIEANESDVDTTQGVLTTSSEEAGAGDQAKKIVLMFLERLSHPSGLKMSNKQQRNNEMVARILPYLTYGEPAAMDALINHFNPYLQNWIAFDHLQWKYQDNPKDENLGQQATKQRSEVENFVRVSESLKTSSCGERLKDIILEKGITSAAVQHLRRCFAVSCQAGFKTSVEWQNALKLPSIPLILSMLRGVSRGHFATQKNIDEAEILPLLHALEGVSGENEIGARAENLLDTLSDKENNGDGFLGEKVCKLRHATRNEMRLRALRKREELLQGLGMRQELSSDGGERIVVARPLIEGLEDVEEEEDGLACMVCREGYTLRPNDILGVYTFSKRVNLGTGSSGGSRGECVYTTVSHFNIIHFQCHQEAKRADAALKNPKKEWDGATLRNNETLCNSIFPLKGSSIPLAQYIRCVDQYWDNLSILGRADGSRLRLLTYDIVLMLARFATGASFSTDSKGGGKESNSRFLPFMIQMACHLLDQGPSGQQHCSVAKSISTFLSSTSAADSPTRSPSLSSGRLTSGGPSDDTVQFMMVSSLLSQSYEEWRQNLLAFLQRGIYHAYMQHTHGRSTLRLSSDSAAPSVKPNESLTDGPKLFTIVQPMLVYTGLIEQLQRFLKYSKEAIGASPSKEPNDDSTSSSASLEKWGVFMRERLMNMKEIVGFSKELLLWLEDMTSSEGLQESFDVMGVLGTVLSSGYSTCEDFVQASIAPGRG